jgi:hypothetical protein
MSRGCSGRSASSTTLPPNRAETTGRIFERGEQPFPFPTLDPLPLDERVLGTNTPETGSGPVCPMQETFPLSGP